MSQPPSIEDCVRRNLDKFFRDLDGEDVSNVYDMVIRAAEKPMLEVVMDRAGGNQSLAAQMLGINRNTLRKKLTDHGLL
ncbi:MAG TPA: Fis family transcriptional regulator [Burkholderiaceae bacterium]|nr:Fis family transcriptional regulator [Burkholderiaceae bacterium]